MPTRMLAAALTAVLFVRPAAAETVTLARALEDGARRGPGAVEAARVHVATAAFARDPGSTLPSVPQATVLAGARSPYNLPTGPEVVVTVQQEVSLRGLGAARRNAADWAGRAAASELERARLEGASLAGLEWVELLEAQELLRLRIAAAADAARLAKVADARATAGVVTGAERALANAEVGTAQVAILDAEGKAYEARLSLAMAIGVAMNEPVVADGRLDATNDALPDGAAVLVHVAQGPAVAAADARARQAAAETSVLHAAIGPTFSFGVSAWREGSGDKAAAAIVSVPLPFFDPARYDTSRQTTLAAAATGRADRLKLEMEHQARLALHEREHTREVRAAIQTNVLAPLRVALSTAFTAYAAGTTDLAVVLLARRSALAAEERSVTAMADVQRADIKLATLAGTLVKK